MMKLFVLAALVAVAAAQMNPSMLMMMNMARSSSGASSSAGAAGGAPGMGGMGGMSRMFNNPMILCRQTDNFKPVPCGQMPALCTMVSMNAYGLPHLMKCSPMGIGCCIKDIQSLIMINQLN